MDNCGDINIETNYNYAKSQENYFYFKNFQIVKVGNNRVSLGKGAYAEVLHVKSKIDGKSYAMKKIEKKKLINKKIIYDEISIHFNFDNNNIIKLYSYSETTEFFYLIMELAENGNLYNIIKTNNGIDEETCRNYFIQVINGISYIHEFEYAHRDIKPENLLLDKNSTIKICDFGGTVKINTGQERKTFFGTYEYMAPEIIEGQNYDKSVDIWALGILLYEMLHGYSPFRIIEKKDNMKEYFQIYENILLTDDLNVAESISDEASHLIKNLLMKDKAKRISVNQIKNHPWINNKKFNNSSLVADTSYFHLNQSVNNKNKSNEGKKFTKETFISKISNYDNNDLDDSVFEKVINFGNLNYKKYSNFETNPTSKKLSIPLSPFSMISDNQTERVSFLKFNNDDNKIFSGESKEPHNGIILNDIDIDIPQKSLKTEYDVKREFKLNFNFLSEKNGKNENSSLFEMKKKNKKNNCYLSQIDNSMKKTEENFPTLSNNPSSSYLLNKFDYDNDSLNILENIEKEKLNISVANNKESKFLKFLSFFNPFICVNNCNEK